MKSAIDVGVPLLVLVAMFVVGTELTIDDFRRIVRRPGIVVMATLGQFIALPVIAWILVSCLPLQPAIAQGVLLVAACPSGTMANLYASLARSNVALSVTLTAVSSLAALPLTPLVLGFLETRTTESQRLTVPLGILAAQLIVLLILPVLSGMVIRHRWPEFTRRHSRKLLGISVTCLVLLLLAIIDQESARFVSTLSEIAVAASLLTILGFAAGWIIGWFGGADASDRLTLGLVFVVRNVGIATAIAVSVLGRLEFAVFATAYFLAQSPFLVALVCVVRRSGAADSINLGKVCTP